MYPGKKKYIKAAPVDSILLDIELSKEQIAKQEQIAKDLVSKLSKYSRNKKRNIENVFGKDSIKRISNLIISSNSDIYWIGNFSLLLKYIDEKELYKILTWRRLDQKTTSYALANKRFKQNNRFSEELGSFRRIKYHEQLDQTKGIFVIFKNYAICASKNNNELEVTIINDENLFEVLLILFKVIFSEESSK